MRFILFTLLIFSQIAFTQNPKIPYAPAKDLSCQKTDGEWKAQLDDNAYYVLREAGTERPYSGLYNDHYKEGVYKCAGCEAPLYISDHKYDSGSGWPAFDRAVEGAVSYKKDNKLSYTRAVRRNANPYTEPSCTTSDRACGRRRINVRKTAILSVLN